MIALSAEVAVFSVVVTVFCVEETVFNTVVAYSVHEKVMLILRTVRSILKSATSAK